MSGVLNFPGYYAVKDYAIEGLCDAIYSAMDPAEARRLGPAVIELMHRLRAILDTEPELQEVLARNALREFNR